MKINNIQAGKINQYYKQLQQKQTEKNKTQNDSTQISAKAKEIMTARAELKKMPQVREEKVAALKEKVQSGNYQVDSKKLAAKILNNVEQV
ncbi:FlgM family anti-sigma-28 factor [Halanaerobium saccharolyticum]|jgi:negative regulator of flagellin synthesis FlgM|uniref:Negative regulator of flagellin synthesis n=1 Tax=Halanaerobium saccharolyticum TaxID=43595 RepID=A0A4R6RH31_9FIRM|nr:flagellar biosynthesis anti-sigma factor FlgM [Halanaerobium saccharolyticum]TDP85650.1 FlgM family anti-sigma-28 factor [Halanaerobium saccharolyticum]